METGLKKKIILIGNNLTNDFLGPHEKFLSTDVNVGINEISRLLGEGDDYGHGPLPSFFLDANRNRQKGHSINLLLLRDLHDPNDLLQQPELVRFGYHNLIGSQGAEFIDPILPIIDHAHTISSPSLSMPATHFQNYMKKISGNDILQLSDLERHGFIFIVCGVYSHIKVLSIASKLRNEYLFPYVYVCPHLVGSKFPQLQLNALQSDFPNALITIIPGLDQIYELAEIKKPTIELSVYAPCALHPEDVKNQLDEDAQMVLQTLFLFHNEIHLTSLSGGYSGSLLLYIQGKKHNATIAPSIVKIDTHLQMQKEIQGYSRVKDLFGQAIPGFALPASHNKRTGIKMEVAAIAGEPQPLQKRYEAALTDKNFQTFFEQLQLVLDMLIQKLYDNTIHIKPITPYRLWNLHTDNQKKWLQENVAHIKPDQCIQDKMLLLKPWHSEPNFLPIFEHIVAHTDRIKSEVCLCHGDLNFANIIGDDRNNVWIIDWTHVDFYPIEMDFAKLENDLKFVLTKNFGDQDLIQLLNFENLLLKHINLPELEHLSGEFSFIRKNDLYLNLYQSIRMIRNAYLKIKKTEFTDLYYVALLKYASHTLSFDKRRERGECDLLQLEYALVSTNRLINHLTQSALHQKRKLEKPENYPLRQFVPNAFIDWEIPFPEYSPPFYVSPLVLANDSTKVQDGWADSENISQRTTFDKHVLRDNKGRPLNPKGRTGIQGRGDLGKWGPNLAVDPIISRVNPFNEDLEIVFVKRKDAQQWSLPGGMMLPNESPQRAAQRSVFLKTNLQIDFTEAASLKKTYIDDFRNTDNAWMESIALHVHLESKIPAVLRLKHGLTTTDAAWINLTPHLINNLFANHADIIRHMVLLMVQNTPAGITVQALQNILAQT